MHTRICIYFGGCDETGVAGPFDSTLSQGLANPTSPPPRGLVMESVGAFGEEGVMRSTFVFLFVMLSTTVLAKAAFANFAL